MMTYEEQAYVRKLEETIVKLEAQTTQKRLQRTSLWLREKYLPVHTIVDYTEDILGHWLVNSYQHYKCVQ